MTVFALMADGGYDGDSLLGIYGSESEALGAGRNWEPPAVFADYKTYVLPVEVGAPAVMRLNDDED